MAMHTARAQQIALGIRPARSRSRASCTAAPGRLRAVVGSPQSSPLKNEASLLPSLSSPSSPPQSTDALAPADPAKSGAGPSQRQSRCNLAALASASRLRRSLGRGSQTDNSTELKLPQAGCRPQPCRCRPPLRRPPPLRPAAPPPAAQDPRVPVPMAALLCERVRAAGRRMLTRGPRQDLRQRGQPGRRGRSGRAVQCRAQPAGHPRRQAAAWRHRGVRLGLLWLRRRRVLDAALRQERRRPRPGICESGYRCERQHQQR